MRVTRKDFYFYFFKFVRHIPIAVFKEPYSGVLNGTRVPCNFFIFYFFLKFDRPILIAAFKDSYSGVLNGTRAPWTWVLCKFFIFYFIIIFFKVSLIALYLIFYKLSFTLKLDFEKIEFQNKGISLISLGNWAKWWIFCAKEAKANFLR